MKRLTLVGADWPTLVVNTFVSTAKIEGKATVRVTKNPKVTAVDEATFARLIDADFKNGIIEVTVLSRLLADAPTKAASSVLRSELISAIRSLSACISAPPMGGPQQVRRTALRNIFPIPLSSLIASGKKPLADLSHTPTWGSTGWITLESRSGMKVRSSI